MPDAALEGPVFIFARESFRVGAGSQVWRTMRLLPWGQSFPSAGSAGRRRTPRPVGDGSAQIAVSAQTRLHPAEEDAQPR